MKNLETSDIRLINENLEKCIIRIHLHTSNAPIVRQIVPSEIHKFTNLRSKEGSAVAYKYMCDLFNQKYSEPQKIEFVKVSAADEVYFERRAFSAIVK